MRIKSGSLAMVAALIFSLGGTSVFADTGAERKTPAAETRTAPTSRPTAIREPGPDEKLRVDMLKLVADAKAGKVAPRQSQFPNTKRNNLSTGAKIGIAAAIGGAIFLIILFHDLSKD